MTAGEGTPPARRAARRHGDYAGLIHELNRRYHREWERAEALRGELDRLRRWTLRPVVEWLRRVKRWLRPPRPEPPLTMAAEPYRPPAGLAPPVGRVSIVIPFRDRPELLRNCLRSLRATAYRRFEVVLVDNGSTDPRTLRLLGRLRGRRVRVVPSPGEFNFARLCNLGAAHARGGFVLFLNNDTEVLSPDWLGHLLAVAADPAVGVVGATLLYPDRTVQHAGLFPRADGAWVHPYRGRPADDPGDGGELRLTRCVPAVTAACLLMRRELFDSLGGFDERFPVAFNDVDLCARVRARGLRVVVTPHARLLHYESLSRGYAAE